MKKLWDVLLFSSIHNKSRNYAELYAENHVNTRLRFVLYFRWTIRSKWQHIVIIHLLLDIFKFESFGLKKWTMKGIKKQLSTKQWHKFSLKWYKCPLFVQYFPIYFVIFLTFELHAVRMRYIWKVFRVIQINMVDIRSQRFFRMNINYWNNLHCTVSIFCISAWAIHVSIPNKIVAWYVLWPKSFIVEYIMCS